MRLDAQSGAQALLNQRLPLQARNRPTCFSSRCLEASAKKGFGVLASKDPWVGVESGRTIDWDRDSSDNNPLVQDFIGALLEGQVGVMTMLLELGHVELAQLGLCVLLLRAVIADDCKKAKDVRDGCCGDTIGATASVKVGAREGSVGDASEHR